MLRRNLLLNRDPLLHVKPRERAHEAFRRGHHRAAGAERRSRTGRPRVGEVIVDLAAHALHLAADDRGGLVVAGQGQPLGLLTQNRQRRLETVGKITGLGDRALDQLRSMVQERVEIVDEGLDLRRIGAVEPLRPAVTDRGQTGLQLAKRGKDAPQLHQPGHEQAETGDAHGAEMHGPARVSMQDQSKDDDIRRRDQSDGPQHGSHHQPRTQGARGLHEGGSIR